MIHVADLQSHESMVTRGKLSNSSTGRGGLHMMSQQVREVTVSTLGKVDSWVMTGFKTVGAIR